MPLTKAGVEAIKIKLNQINEVGPGNYIVDLSEEQTAKMGALHITNYSIEMERDIRAQNHFIHIPCNKIVANKLDKFFKIVMKHKINVIDLYIYEWPHPAWMPETEGTYGGFINVIVEKATDDFLGEIAKKLPMISAVSTPATKISDFKW
jgi:hypothetical protein